MEIPGSSLPTLRDADFQALRQLIKEAAGIHLSDAKRQLVTSRLAGRLRALGLSGYGEYCEYLRRSDAGGAERREMVNCITTNKTSFFREPHHFDFLRERVFPAAPEGEPLRIWSAGCSTGPEPYTLAIAAREFYGEEAERRVRIEATDIDTRVLETARRGVYEESCAGDLPEALRPRYLLRGTGSWAGRVRVSPDLQSLVSFQPLNLMDPGWPFRRKFDVIFCRNVIIYFDAPTRARLIERFAEQLVEGGHLVLGHSEGLHAEQHLFESLGRTVFRLRERPAGRVERSTAAPAPADRSLPRQAIRLGEVHASARPGVVSTLLGSCVAVCLYDPEAGVGGMNHYCLPEPPHGESGASPRYGRAAMRELMAELERRGASRERLRAKVFGAAELPPASDAGAQVARVNACFALEWLDREGIPVVAERLGGGSAIEVRLYTHTGEALVRCVQPEPTAPVAAA